MFLAYARSRSIWIMIGLEATAKLRLMRLKNYLEQNSELCTSARKAAICLIYRLHSIKDLWMRKKLWTATIGIWVFL